MSTGEDEPSPSLNGRLRPRKSTSTTTPSPQNKTIRKTEGKLAQDRPKRTITPSKASPTKQDDLVTKSDSAPAPLFLCPYCDRKFNTKQTASKHARRIHLSTSKQDNFIKCLYCNHSDAESNAIIKHMVDSHPNQYFACLDCHTRFPSTTELAEHKHNVCEKQKPYRSKLRQKTSPGVKKNPKKTIKNEKTRDSNESSEFTDDLSFDGIVISCELKPSGMHDEADIEDNITTNLILPSSKTLGNTAVDKNAVIVLDDLQWNKRIPPNFSFRNSDADQILSRLGVVHRSPRVGESRKDLIRMMDASNEKFEKCFDTSFYSKVAKNVQENLAKYLDGTFNFNPNKDTSIKTRKSKASVIINTAEGFPILLAHEQFSRNLFDGFIPRTMAPKHKWKWDSTENDKNLVMLLDQSKRDSHVNSCIITLISSLDIWTQLRMKSKFEAIFKNTPTAKKTEKQNLISRELKEILESRDIPSSSSHVVQYKKKPIDSGAGSELPAYLGLSARSGEFELQPAVLSGEWVRPRCYVCCACGDQTRDARTLTAHLATQHPNAQVQHYEIVGETLLSADILQHLYVPPSQIPNRTRPPRGFRDCTKCKKSVTLEDLHQHMLDCAGDTPTVRRKCRYRPFGVRRRRPRLPDNTIRKKMRKDMRSRHRQKSHMRPRPKIRTEVGDAETIRKMIADLPAKRNRITPMSVLRPRRTVIKAKKQVKLRSPEDRKSRLRPIKSLKKPNKTEVVKKDNDTDNSSTLDEDDQPLKLSATRVLTKKSNGKETLRRRATIVKAKKKKQKHKQDQNIQRYPPNNYSYNTPNYNNGLPNEVNSEFPGNYYHDDLIQTKTSIYICRSILIRSATIMGYPPYPYFSSNLYAMNDLWYSTPMADIIRRRNEEAVLFQMHRQYALQSCHRQIDLGAAQYANTTHNQYVLPSWHQQIDLGAAQSGNTMHNLAFQSWHQQIDLRNAGSSNVRQHSGRGRNYKNVRNGKGERSAGRGDGGNRNNNIPQAPTLPLRHSIASLTSDTEGRDASMLYQNPYLLLSQINKTFIHTSADGRKEFENEATVEKVDKPPLRHNPTQNEHRPAQSGSIAACNFSAFTPLPCDVTRSRNPIVPPHLSNVTAESRAAREQMLLQKDLIRPDVQRPVPSNPIPAWNISAFMPPPCDLTRFRNPILPSHLSNELAESLAAREQMHLQKNSIGLDEQRPVPRNPIAPCDLSVYTPPPSDLTRSRNQMVPPHLSNELVKSRAAREKILLQKDSIGLDEQRPLQSNSIAICNPSAYTPPPCDQIRSGNPMVPQHLSKDLAESRAAREQMLLQKDSIRIDEQTAVPSNPIAACNLSAYTPPPCDLSRSQNPIVPQHLSNEPVEYRTPSEQTLLQKDSIGLHGSQMFFEQSLTQKDPKDLAGPNLEHKIGVSNTDTKIETDKSKSNKTRKGLNDCIAMLRTKKGLRLEITSEHVEDENMDSEIIDLETVDSEVPPAVDLDSSLSASNTTEEKAKESMNVAPAAPNKDGGLSAPISLAQADNSYILQKTIPIDSEHALINPNHHESEINLSSSSNCTRSEITNKHCPVVGAQSELSPDISLLSKHSDDDNSDLNVLQNKERYSPSEITDREEIDSFSCRNRVSQLDKTRTDFNLPNLTQAVFDSRANLTKDKEEDAQLLHEYNHRNVANTQMRQSTPESALMIDKADAQAVLMPEQAVASTAHEIFQRSLSTENLNDVILPSQQSNVSPPSRRSRRKPIKRTANLEPQPDLNSEKSIPQKHAVVSPLYHDSRGNRTSPIDSNMRFHRSSYLQAVSPPHETLPLKTPPPPPPPPPPSTTPPNFVRVRRESFKQVEPSATVVEKRDSVSLTKIVRTSPGVHAENIMNMHNLHRHSIELANLQATTANCNNLMAYREQYEKALVDILQTSQGLSHPRKINPDNSVNESARYDKSNDYNRNSSNSTFMSMSHDKHGIMHVNPRAFGIIANKTNTHETQDNTSYENEQFLSVHKQKSDNLEAKKDHSMKFGEHADKYSSQETTAMKRKLSALDTTSRRLPYRRTSEVFYSRPLPYKNAVPNINTPDRSLDLGLDEKKERNEQAVRAYQEPATSFAVPAHSKNIRNTQQDANSLKSSSSCESNVEEMVPLDLSRESKIRYDQPWNSSEKKSDISQNICIVPIRNENKTDGLSMNPNLRSNYSEQLRNLSQHSLLSSESDPVKEFVHQLDPNVSLQKSEIHKNQEMSAQQYVYQPELSASLAQSVNCANSELFDRSCNKSSQAIKYNDENITQIKNTGNANTENCTVDQLQSLPPECNYFLPQGKQITNSKAIYHQENNQEKLLLEKEKITQPVTQLSPGANIEDGLMKNVTPCALTNAVNLNEENINPHGSYLYMSHRMTSADVEISNANDRNNQNNSTVDINSREMNSQISNNDDQENDIMQIEQDAETARKIAMLPEELVKILGTIPKDHRNQLLNVLPQYVSTSLTIAENNSKNILYSADIHESNGSRAETKQNISASSDSNRLSINTAISPSSIIPKKRLSPSHSRGRLNSSESQSTGPTLPPSVTPTLSQRSPIEHNEFANNLKYSQFDCSIKTNEFENISLDPILKTSEKERTNKNLYELSKPTILNKNNEASASVGTFFPNTASQDLISTPKAKQKPSNEQTASLRAVRIKTISTKKSYPDKNTLLTNYCYSTNVTVNDKCSNSGHIINPGHQACNINPTDPEYENAKLNNQQIENNRVTDVVFRDVIEKNTDYFQDRSQNIDTEIISDTNVENNDNFTHRIVYHKEVCQNESNIITHDTTQDSLQSKNMIMLEHPSPMTLQETNVAVDNFFEQMNSTISPNEVLEDKSVLKLRKMSSDSDSKKEPVIQFEAHQNDFTQKLMSKVFKETINTTAIRPGKCHDDNKEVQQLSPNSTKNHYATRQDNASEDEVSDKTFVEKSTKNCHATTRQNNASKKKVSGITSVENSTKNQDATQDNALKHVVSDKTFVESSTKNQDATQDNASKDEVSDKTSVDSFTKNHDGTKQDNVLKHEVCDKTFKKNQNDYIILIKNEKSNEDDSSEDDITLAVIKQKQCSVNSKIEKYTSKHANASIRIKSKDKKKQLKVMSKRQKKKLTKSMEIDQNSKLSADVESSKEIIQSADIDIVCNEDNNDNSRFFSDILSTTTAIEKVSNKTQDKENDIIESINNIKETDASQIPEPNAIENSIDNSVYKNEQKITPNTSIISDTYCKLQSDKNRKSASEELPELSELNISSDVKFSKTFVAEESQSKTKNIYSGDNSLSDVVKESELNLSSAVINETKQNIEEVKDSTAITSLATTIHSFPSDFQLCSEIPEVYTLPLRRSKRGKSMYIDSVYLEDSEQIDDHTKKTPLTMKRLILSRVEKDKKRISESSTLEKSGDATDDHLSITSEEPEITCIQEKNAKRKKSPHSKCLSKKIKPTSPYEPDEELLDPSTLGTSENSCILRELPNAENKITETDSNKDELKCLATSSLSINSTIISEEKESNVTNNNLTEIKETTVPVKRKLNTTNTSDIVPLKSKKTKYHRKKPQSDFDSDDDKVLVETKPRIAIEKPLLDDQDLSNMSKEDYDVKSPSNNEASNDKITQTAIASVSSETRVTCYSRSISNRKPRSSSTSYKDHVNYDPYDIDFIDMPETTGPVIKKKGKNAKPKLYHDHVKKELNNSSSKVSKETVAKIQSNMNNESDSDSSKSDVPLQKYVDEKTLKVDLKNKNYSSSIEPPESTEEKNILAPKCLDVKTLITEDHDDDKKTCSISNAEVPPTPCKIRKSTKRVTGDNICESDTPIKDDCPNTNNNISVDQTTQKQSHKSKKSRRTPAAHNVDSIIVSSEEIQQLQSDKFMENFGFYSERIPRKSNLLASKKISETFHMICNESEDSLFSYKEKSPKKSISSESKKKLESGSNINTSQDSGIVIGDVTNLDVQSAEPKIDVYTNEPGDVKRIDDNVSNPVTAQAIIDSEDVRNLENDTYSNLEAAKPNTQNSLVGYQSKRSNNIDINAIAKVVDQNDSLSQIEDKIAENPDTIKKSKKSRQHKQPGIKNKMYPDIEEIDMFEDKFDKIKRKRRSQAVAAKQVQVVAETNTSVKSRKQSERKKSTKSTKKNTQVPTKGALKGFEGIKISIPTQDLNIPINLSPPRQSKKQRKNTVKRKKETSFSHSSGTEFEDKEKSVLERDIYEFKDSEDTELFDLRPSTVMDRFRSMHSKNKYKNKDKAKDVEKVKTSVKERKAESKASTNFETAKEGDKNTNNENERRQKKCFSREQGQCIEIYTQRGSNYDEKNLEELTDEESRTKIQKCSKTPGNHKEDNSKKEADSARASTSSFIPDQMQESDYESELSSPEGDFIFYMSNDINCVCSDNDSDDSDIGRGCGRLNCVNKIRNADKNAAIENIFKNNAVRCEKPDIKEPEKPRPNFDQLFDSLLETESKPYNNDISEKQKSVTVTSNIDIQRNISIPLSPLAQHNLTESKDHASLLNKDLMSILDESYNITKVQPLPSNSKYESKNMKTNEHNPSKSDHTSSLCQKDIMSDSDSMQIFSIDNKPKENLGYSLMSEESTQVNFTDIIAYDTATKNEANDKDLTNVKATKTSGSNQLTNYNSEDDFDIDKPETLNRQYMHLILPAEKASTSAQTENNIDNFDAESCNESAATKYLKGLTPSEAAKMEFYTMVSAQSTQTERSKRRESDSSKHDDFILSKSEDVTDMLVVPRNRIRLQKYDIREIAHKSISTKSIQTDKNNSYKSQYDAQGESDDAGSDDNIYLDKRDHSNEEPDLVKGKSSRGSIGVFHGDNNATRDDTDAFTAPASRSTTEKHSPRKSEEDMSTSLDYGVDAFDNAGVARQRARRKCTVGKQNVLAEHWSSESEFDGAPPRPNSADSVVASASRKKKSRKKEGHHMGGRKASRHLSKSEIKGARGRTASGGRSEDSDACAGASGSGTRAPPGPKMRARVAHHYWSSESEDAAGPQPQHGWIVGDSHKKLVTMLAHAKGRKRNNADKHLD